MGVGLRRQPRVLSVSELSARIAGALDAEIGKVWVAGELSNCRRADSGHLYFSLKDETAQLDAAMFRRELMQLVFEPTNGTEVVVYGRVGVWRGRLQIYADHMEPLGLGALRLAFEQLKARLAAEGLFDQERKRSLPPTPGTIGLVTALAGAAVHDMLRVLGDRWPAARVVIRPVRVQGPGAAEEIARGIAALHALPDVEVLVVGRGGGSLEDLWAFNEEVVARAIAASRVPVVSAVGHEVDFTIADFVADVRAPTPTAAASLVVPDRRELARRVAQCRDRLRGGLERRLHLAGTRLDGLGRRLGDPRRRVADATLRVDDLATRARQALVRRVAWDRRELRRLVAALGKHEPRAVLAAARARVGHDRERLQRTVERQVGAARGAFEREQARLAAFSPLACLERGYAIVQREDAQGTVVRDATTLAQGEPVRLVLARGRARAHIDSTES
ncbi:MAG TPA: exodeoxyribonuclease VII large subunit [Candidatus Eisenbacteria bacterium]|nr:exodeoxyribonuclease VII large subunit [Candidatus Eisenbacteria bacterium]